LYAGAEKETFLKLKEEEEKEIRDFHSGRDSVEMLNAAAFMYHIYFVIYVRVCNFLHSFCVDLWLRRWWCWWWRAWRSETQLHYYTTDNMRKNSFTKGHRRVCISLIFY
jgi:hypothetical protein